MEQVPDSKREPSESGNRSKVELVFVDEDVLEELVTVATTDAAPDEVTPPLGKGWTPERVEWLHDFHRRRRDGLAGDEKEETAAIRVNGRMIGATRLHRASPEAPDRLEWGIWLARSSRGLGLGDAVLRLIAARARMVGASRLVAETTATNAPMIATLRRAGAILSKGADGVVHAEILLDDGT